MRTFTGGYRKNIRQEFLISPFYCTINLIYCHHKQKGRLMTMYQMRYVGGHIQVYDGNGKFLFSADTEREAREEWEDYAESAA